MTRPLVALTILAAAPPPIPDEAVDALEVTVTARARGAAAHPDAIDHYQRLCFDPARRTGAFAPPAGNPGWRSLAATLRARFGVTADVPAYATIDAAGATLVSKFEDIARPDRLREIRCTIVIIGGPPHANLPGRVSALFRGPGTERHVGQNGGVPRIPGWRQWLWSAMPGLGTTAWRSTNADGPGPPSWLTVTDPALFYAEHKYVAGDLKTRLTGDRALSMLSLSVISRPGRDR